jgi:hypothetical protein
MPRHIEEPTGTSPHWHKPFVLGLVLLSGPLSLPLLADNFVFYRSTPYTWAAWTMGAVLWLWFGLKFSLDPRPGSWRTKAMPASHALGAGAMVAAVIVLAPLGWMGSWTALFGEPIIERGWIENAGHYSGAQRKRCDQHATLVFAQIRHDDFCVEGKLPLPVRSRPPVPVQVTLRHSAIGYVIHSVEAGEGTGTGPGLNATADAPPAPAP